MNERKITVPIVESLNKVMWAYKIPDMPAFKGQKTRFGPVKPFDIVGDYNNKFIAIEVKFFNGYKTLNRKVFQKFNKKGELVRDQLTELLKHENCFVFVVFWESRSLNRLYVLSRPEINTLIRRGGITRKQFQESPYYIDYYKGYDMNKFLVYLEI